MGEDGIHVLHVDDDPSVTDLSATLLAEQGLRVATETDPEAAAERFDPAAFDCVVSDYEMPRLDGLDLYRRLRSQFDHADFPYILFTGKGNERVAAEALNVGVTGYLQKGGPEQYDCLAGRIESATTQYQAESGDFHFEALFDTIPDPAVIVDLASGAPVVRRINDAFEETFGYESEALVDESINDFLVSDDRLSEAREMDERSGRDESATREVRYETADDERRDFLFRNVPVELGDAALACGIYTDITERKEYERKLAALHTTTRELLAADSVDAVAEIGISAAQAVLNHDITAVSFYDEQRSGLEPAASTDRVSDLLGEIPTIEPGESAAWQAYEHGERIVDDDIDDESDLFGSGTSVHSEMVLPLGDHGIWIVGSTERSAFGETERSLGRVLAANIEAALDQIKREQALRESERAFRRENERLDEFASVVSHDLRNPLSLAQGHLDLAAQKYDGDADHLAKVSKAHDRMGALIEDVLTWAREGEMVESTVPVAVDHLARECWESLSGDGSELAVETDSTVLADRDRFRRLLENLLGNAVEHGGDDVTVCVGALEDGDGLYVADDGPGVRPENRSDIFESGYTLSDDGNGFGLAIVEQIVEAHGWSVSVTDSESGGARFEITEV